MSGVDLNPAAERIRKPEAARAAANLKEDPAASRVGWETCRSWLQGFPGGGLNIAWEAIDRHVAAGRGAKEAIRWIDRGGGRHSYSYADLKAETDRFAHLLRQLGHGPGVRVFSLLGRVPDLYFAALGTLKAGGVFCPLYSAFGPEPVGARMKIGAAEVLITDSAGYEKKVRPMRDQLPALRHVLLVDGGAGMPDVVDLAAARTDASPEFDIAQTRPEDMALLHFTEALKLEDKVGTMLPCNVVVQAQEDRSSEVAAVDPVASMQAIENPRLADAAEEVRQRLSRVIESLRSEAAADA